MPSHLNTPNINKSDYTKLVCSNLPPNLRGFIDLLKPFVSVSITTPHKVGSQDETSSLDFF